MHVREIMTTRVNTCRPEDTLNVAARMMWEDDIGAVPVVDGDRGVLGMLTDRDLCMAAYTRGLPLTAISASDVMSKKIYSCKPSVTLAQAEQLMREHQVRRLPVVDDDNQLVGILTLNDLARATHGSRRGHAELVGTIAAICAPRKPVAVTPAA
jgi:CBS domain-containing protein